jgi:tRNA pseudouridine55 synthase
MILDRFTGPQLQTPPMFSAKKVDGERLYKAARAGREVTRKAVSILVHSIALIEGDGLVMNEDGTRDFKMRVRCSSGTYVRTLANDIGERLEVGAHLATLRRTAVGHFGIAESHTLNELEEMSRDDVRSALIRTSDMLSPLRAISLDDDQLKRVTNGRAFQISQAEAARLEDEGGSLRLCDSKGKLVAVGDFDPRMQVVSPRVVLDVEAL